MEYAQLNLNGTYSHQINTRGNVEWDATHFCPASALTPAEAQLFRVVPLTETAPPAIDPLTHAALRDGGEYVGGKWQYKWTITALTAEQAVAARQARVPAKVSFRQAKTQLQLAGLWDGAIAAANAIADPVIRIKTLGLLMDSMEYERHRPELIGFATGALGMTEAQLDDLFLAAATL